jgi:hypothetical protein
MTVVNGELQGIRKEVETDWATILGTCSEGRKEVTKNPYQDSLCFDGGSNWVQPE